MIRCSHTIGFLTRLPCGEPADLLCSLCGIPICGKHRRPGGDGFVCPSCTGTDRDSSSSRDRDSSPYSSSDYDTFDTFAGGGGEMGGGGASGSWDEDAAGAVTEGGDADLFQDS